MTTAFQWVFDNASEISIDKKPTVASTITRDGTVRATSRGGDTWRFTVTMPAGMRWSTSRSYLAKMSALDRHTVGTVNLQRSGYASWLGNYLGDSDTLSGFGATWTTGNTVTLSTVPAGSNLTSGEVTLSAGDWIQLGSDSVYEVVEDVIYPSTTVTLNRPVIESAGSATIKISGDTVDWSVICMNFPTWTIIDRDIVSFDGAFTFYENLL